MYAKKGFHLELPSLSLNELLYNIKPNKKTNRPIFIKDIQTCKNLKFKKIKNLIELNYEKFKFQNFKKNKDFIAKNISPINLKNKIKLKKIKINNKSVNYKNLNKMNNTIHKREEFFKKVFNLMDK